MGTSFSDRPILSTDDSGLISLKASSVENFIKIKKIMHKFLQTGLEIENISCIWDGILRIFLDVFTV